MSEKDSQNIFWVACDKCKAHSVTAWSHAGCIGRYCEEQCDPDFTCRACREKLKADRSAESKSADQIPRQELYHKPCTPFCAPPGCLGGFGCSVGMGRLGNLEYDCIKDVIRHEGEWNRDYLRRNGIDGEEAVLQTDTYTCRRCIVRKWNRDAHGKVVSAEIEYVEGEITLSRTIERCHIDQIKRFAPRPTTEDLEAIAVDVGCTRCPPYAKQLRYEMRNARRELKIQRPETINEYISRVTKEGHEAEEDPPALA